jgi:5-hydroxyisourate hydrolase-like protein (transthyretin family)
MENGKKAATEKPLSLEKTKELIENITRYETDYERLLNALTAAAEHCSTGIYRLEFDINKMSEFMIFPRHHSKYDIIAITYEAGARKMRLYIEVV